MSLKKQVRRNKVNVNNDWAKALEDTMAVNFNSITDLMSDCGLIDAMHIGDTEAYSNDRTKTINRLYADNYFLHIVKIIKRIDDGSLTFTYTPVVSKEAYRLGFMFKGCEDCIAELNIVSLMANGLEISDEDIEFIKLGAFSYFASIGELFDYEGKTFASILVEMDDGGFLKVVAREDNTISSFTLESDETTVSKKNIPDEKSKEELEALKLIDNLFN